jgi:hypothetical protein
MHHIKQKIRTESGRIFDGTGTEIRSFYSKSIQFTTATFTEMESFNNIKKNRKAFFKE